MLQSPFSIYSKYGLTVNISVLKPGLAWRVEPVQLGSGAFTGSGYQFSYSLKTLEMRISIDEQFKAEMFGGFEVLYSYRVI